MAHWDNKVAVVTGASAGLGRAIVEALARANVHVAAIARGKERLEAVAADLDGHRSMLPIAADVTRQVDVDRATREVVDRFGRIDALINCAGRSDRAEILDTTPEQMQALWEVNLLAAVRMTRACGSYLLQAQGHVVNIGSLASKTASAYLGAYPAAKHALAAYSQQLRLELGPRGLHVLLVCPGPIARDEAGPRYAGRGDLPAEAHRPGGGAKVKALDPRHLAAEILEACEKRRAELVRPKKARVLFAAAALSPRLGDWLLRRVTPP